LVASEDALQRTWVGGERTLTSIIDFGELYEQIFGDLDSDACLAEFGPMMGREVASVVERFLDAVKECDLLVSREADLQASEALLTSLIWRDVREAAGAVIGLPDAQQCRSGRRDIRL
jgi:hypothetical protein